MSVVKFPTQKNEDAMWVCSCGCATFELNADGTATCRGCRTVPEEGGWKVRKDDDPTFDYPHSFIDGGNGAGFAERKIKREAQAAEWIICGTWAGRITAWADGFIETPEQESWLRNAVETGLTQILEDKPA